MHPWPFLSYSLAKLLGRRWGVRHDGYLRENKSVAVDPFGILRVKLHEFVEKNVGNRCHAPTNL